MTNILVDARWFRSGKRGLGMFAYSLLRALAAIAADDMRITVAIPASSVGAFRQEFGSVFGIIHLPTLPDPFLDLLYFPLYLLKYRFDLVHFTGNTGLLIPKRQCKVLLTVHDVSFMKSSAIVPWPRKPKQILGRIYRRLMVPICVRRADKVITVSEFAVRDLCLELRLSRAPEFIYHGVSETGVTGLAPPLLIALATGSYLVIGGSDPQKNIARIVEAFSSLYKKYGMTAPVVVVIGVNLREFVGTRSGAGVSPNIHFVGHIDHSAVQEAIEAAKCVIVPSLYESFGLPLIEALSVGKAVICSNRGALPEIGQSAPVYFDPAATDSLTDAIEQVERTPDRSNALSAWRAGHVDIFSWHRCAERYLAAYSELIR